MKYASLPPNKQVGMTINTFKIFLIHLNNNNRKLRLESPGLISIFNLF